MGKKQVGKRLGSPRGNLRTKRKLTNVSTSDDYSATSHINPIVRARTVRSAAHHLHYDDEPQLSICPQTWELVNHEGYDEAASSKTIESARAF
jgi:hypothetical protein